MIPIIPEIFENIVNNVKNDESYTGDLYYYFGHPLEINNILGQEDQTRKVHYPAVFLFLDLVETRDINGKWGTIDPTLVIVTETNQQYLAEQRLENSFKSVLYPIYELLLKYLRTDSNFNNTFINHTKRDHYFYGSDMNKGKSSFDQKFDAIELNIRDLEMLKNC